jgi:hypothetical protein
MRRRPRFLAGKRSTMPSLIRQTMTTTSARTWLASQSGSGTGGLDERLCNSLRQISPPLDQGECRTLRRHVPGEARLHGQRFHDAIKLILRFKADPGNVRELDVAVFDRDAISKSAEGPKDARIGLSPPQSQSGGQVERHLMTPMGNAALCRPAGHFHGCGRTPALLPVLAQQSGGAPASVGCSASIIARPLDAFRSARLNF